MDPAFLTPSLFVAHGSPMLGLEGGPWGEAMTTLGRSLPPLRGILVCSAHWETAGGFRVTSADPPGILHDFGGFPEPLYAQEYPAPGAPELAGEVARLLSVVGQNVALDGRRPLDHGVWVPLRYLVPRANIPVVQLSLPRAREPEVLLAAGRALAPLRYRGVLLLGSGGIVHNLSRLDWDDQSGPEPWASAFDGWVRDRLNAGETEALSHWHQAPGAAASVPTSEHLDPLFLLLGATAGPPTAVFQGWQLGNLSLASYLFQP